MGQIIRSGSILVYILGLTIPYGLSVPDSQFYMTEEVRVKRQAGYVYNRPSVPFDLPARAPSAPAPVPAPPPTQAPTVDRIQAQMMYYAYPAPPPAPASGGAPAAANSPAAAGGSSAGYNYGSQAQGAGVAQTGAVQSRGGVQAAGAAGYSYNTPASNSGSNAGSFQTSSSGSSQANAGAQGGTSSDSSGYSYEAPKPTPAPQPNSESIGVSTNAPKYLPPLGGDLDVRDINAGSAPALTAAAGYSGSTSSGNPGYGAGGGPAAIPTVTDQYLPPLTQSNTENTLPSPNVNIATNTVGQTNGVPVEGPSAAYIPPGPDRPPSSDVTPRPFAPPSPPSPPSPGGYLPPVDTNISTNQGSVSTPASTYLPPVL